jgi:mono/diheme cytochrome c family protein
LIVRLAPLSLSLGLFAAFGIAAAQAGQTGALGVGHLALGTDPRPVKTAADTEGLFLTLNAQRLTPTPEALEFFETKIRPLLVRRCQSCHGRATALGGLSVTSRAALLKGGKRGPALSEQKPEESLLLHAVAYTDSALKMPPAGKLPDAEIAALTAWVKQGAPWPSVAASTPNTQHPTPNEHWAFLPVRTPPVPRVKNGAWVRNPIDAFILARLEKDGMRPAPPTGPRELIRRVTFDLTGLPPTPEEVDEFVNECRADGVFRSSGVQVLGTRSRPKPDLNTRIPEYRGIRTSAAPPISDKAYERLVDRLLASPRYGERWARYWLDVVRYADSNGYERDAEKPYSWKYRDYVIASLNADKPYDRFVKEQLAGDELPDRSEEMVTATGLLRLGTWDDEPNDAVEYQYERLDDLVHTTSTAFLGMTVRCARCHDHKFDPIPQTDYYALGAAFWGGYVQPGDGRLLGGPPPERIGFPVLGFTDSGREAPPLHLLQNGDPRREGPVVPPGFLTPISTLRRTVAPPPPDAKTTRRRLQLAEWIADPNNPLTARVMVNRVWQHHFGEGIVRTPNNFGRKGDPPTHPELLDWLAAAFVSTPTSQRSGMGVREYGRVGAASRVLTHTPTPPYPHTPPNEVAGTGYGCGWSLKRLHRLFVTSATYRMASVHPQEAAYAQKDFANERWWRFNRRRLDADALRDSLLAVSGQLNPAMGGRGFTPAVSREALEGLSRKGAEWNVSPPDEQRRRSIYMFLKRALLVPFMTVFDFGDTTQPLEHRETAVVPPQALALMNSAFANEQAQSLARRVRQEAGADTPQQVERLWRLALGRAPGAAERQAALRHLERVAGEAAAAPPATPETRSPEQVEGLRLWLRADRGVTLDDAGRVQRWADQSGLGFDFEQMDPAARPEVERSGLGAQPALRFDGRGRFLTQKGQVVTSPSFTIVAVATDRAGGGSHREIFSNWRREDNIGPAIFLGTTGTATVRFSDAFAPAGTLSRPENPFTLTAVTGPIGSAVYQDRSVLAERAAGLPGRNLKGPYVVGQQGNIQGEYWNGQIAELLVYNRALTPEELTAVWEHLSQRYPVARRPVPPTPAEKALASLCHVVINSNEFIYVD